MNGIYYSRVIFVLIIISTLNYTKLDTIEKRSRSVLSIHGERPFLIHGISALEKKTNYLAVRSYLILAPPYILFVYLSKKIENLYLARAQDHMYQSNETFRLPFLSYFPMDPK